MRRVTLGVVSWLVCLAALVVARQAGGPPTPTFRGGVDLVELDVSALDKDRHPVRGLTQGDFTVTIDGKPRRIVAFKAVDLPAPPPPPAASWVRDVAPDVATNTHPGGRVVAIVIDDGSFGQADGREIVGDLRAIEKTREVARKAVDALGPDDLAAVIFTENNHTAQDFTSDRRRLHAAIDDARLLPGSVADGEGDTRGSCLCGVCSIEALQRVAESLRSLSQERKTILDISVGRTVRPAHFTEVCNVRKREAMASVFQEAQRANVTIEVVDPKGLVGVRPMGNGPAGLRLDFLRTMAETTGGRAVLNNNDMEREVPALLEESRSYYLLGVERPIARDGGEMHPVKVTVGRRGVDVRTRDGYYSPTEKNKQVATSPSHGIDASIADAVPKADIPLEVAVAPFAADKGNARLAIVLGVSQHGASTRAHQEPIDLVVSTFDPDSGKSLGLWRQHVTLAWNAGATAGQYEVLSLMPVLPGRYELRMGVQTGDAHTASVYAYAEVPKFSDEPLSMSGLIVSSTPAPTSAPKDTFIGLLPVVPTARRAFSQTDHVKAFVRVYEGGSRPLAPITITTHIVDTSNKTVGDDGSKEVEPMAFSKSRTFDYSVDVPTSLPAGEYLLTINGAAGKNAASRMVRYRVEP